MAFTHYSGCLNLPRNHAKLGALLRSAYLTNSASNSPLLTTVTGTRRGSERLASSRAVARIARSTEAEGRVRGRGTRGVCRNPRPAWEIRHGLTLGVIADRLVARARVDESLRAEFWHVPGGQCPVVGTGNVTGHFAGLDGMAGTVGVGIRRNNASLTLHISLAVSVICDLCHLCSTCAYWVGYRVVGRRVVRASPLFACLCSRGGRPGWSAWETRTRVRLRGRLVSTQRTPVSGLL